jgi:hypothetical protein
MIGKVDITSRPNIDSVKASIFNLDPFHKDPMILVTGKVGDVCRDAMISYTGPEGAGTTVNLARWTATAVAPPTAYAAEDGKFSYEIKVTCCPGAQGQVHDIDVDASMTVLYVRSSAHRIHCLSDGSITISGQMAGAASGRISVSLINPAGERCAYETMIARDH